MNRRIAWGLLALGGCILAAASESVAGGSYSLGEVTELAIAQAPGTPAEGAWSGRSKEEGAVTTSRWAILPHRPNYILPWTYNTSVNNKPLKEADSDAPNMDNAEAKFQISFKLPVWESIFASNFNLYFAYSQISFWQVYNTENSSPFRDTNYEPEAVVVYNSDLKVLGFGVPSLALGLVHQSNGRGSQSLSRSWNRVYAAAVVEKGNFILSLKPWWRIPEDRKEPGDTKGDDNPHIEKYMGYGELRAGYKWGNQVFALMFRNNLRSDNKGAIELDWSFPLTKKLKGYVQYFNGYGESLIDYNHANSRIGVGVLLSDWL